MTQRGKRQLLSEDYDEIKLVDDATRATWEPKPPKLTPARRKAAMDAVRRYRERKAASEKRTTEQP